MSRIIAKKIVKAIMPRVWELAERAERKNLNDAYVLAFNVGILCDIEDIIKKEKAKK